MKLLLPFLATWSPENFGQWVGTTAVFAALGTIALLVAVLLFDKIHHIDYKKELGENKNPAAAIVLAAFILGVAYIVGKAVGQ